MIKDKKHYRIHIIEDNPGDLMLIEDYLSEWIEHPHILHSTSFDTPIGVLESNAKTTDLILLDLSLPDMSGTPLVEALLKKAGTVPVIVLTGFSDIEFSTRSIALGVADYLVKDELNAMVLYKSMVYAIERRKTQARLEESEKRYGDLFNLSPQPMLVYDEDTLQVMQVNQAAISHYGYTEDEFLALTVLDIRPPGEVASTKIRLEKRKQSNAAFNQAKFKHQKKNGEVIDVEIYCQPIIVRNRKCRSVIVIDVTERNEQEQRVTKAIIKTQEEERYEIGGELHDNVCQILGAGLMSMGMLKGSLKKGNCKFYKAAQGHINMAIDEIRSLSHRLAPAFFNDSTLKESIDSLIKPYRMASQVDIQLEYDPLLQEKKLHRDLQLNIYRILQEQLRNIEKYADASLVKIQFMLENDQLIMVISDNGKGFDPQQCNFGIGLSNMQRRAELFSGSFALDSAPGHGCKITIGVQASLETV